VLQLKNISPFAAAMGVLPDASGIDTLYVIIKGTFTLEPQVAVAEKQAAPTLVDVYWGDAGASSLRYSGELHLPKPGTDVILNGLARGTRPRDTHLVTLTAGRRRKDIQVFGDRVWSGSGRPSSPEPFLSMPLVYERAFGGVDRAADGSLRGAEERNPVGVGFTAGRSAREMAGERLPNLEDPRQLLTRVGDRALPACAGFVAASWLPRRQYAGSYDEAWQKSRAPYLPADFQPLFFHAACPEMTFAAAFQGGEPVSIRGVSVRGDLLFAVPRCALRVSARVAGRVQRGTVQLETVLVESEMDRFVLTWRAAIPCDKRALKIDVVTVALDGLDMRVA
jgi:hypothetical protein